MLTTDQVEARLRAAAAACEPVAAALGDDDPVEPRRPRRAPLVALAAALVVGAALGAALLADDDGDEVVAARTTAEPALAEGWSVLRFADGTAVAVRVPGPTEWVPAVAEVGITVADAPPHRPLQVHLADGSRSDWAAARGATLAPTAAPEASLATSGLGSWLLVEQDGVTASRVVEMGGQVVTPPEVVDHLARHLRFHPTDEGVVGVGGDGITVASARWTLRPEAAVDVPGPELLLSVEGPGVHPSCAEGAPPLSADLRCRAGGRVLVTAYLDPAQAVLDEVEVALR